MSQRIVTVTTVSISASPFNHIPLLSTLLRGEMVRRFHLYPRREKLLYSKTTRGERWPLLTTQPFVVVDGERNEEHIEKNKESTVVVRTEQAHGYLRSDGAVHPPDFRQEAPPPLRKPQGYKSCALQGDEEQRTQIP